VLSALGGQDELIKKVLDNIVNQKVNHEGTVSSYSSDNKFTWLEITVSKQMREAVKSALLEMLVERHDEIKTEIKKQLSSKKGIEKFASAMLDAQAAKISEKYSTKIDLSFGEIKGY
jgi:uncharacterized phage protein gp47/JayE